jgi:AcrR family transcriptional regulator
LLIEAPVARTVNPAIYAIRREAFVDAAQHLIETIGYEPMSVQDVLNELDASRGAFYHYFDSKAALLEAVIERMTDQALASLAPLLDDPGVPADRKLAGVFSGIARWKSDRRDLVLALIDVWTSDGNAIVREKFRRGLVDRIGPVLAGIIREGIAEGVFSVRSPDGAARVLVSIIQGAGEEATELYLARQADQIPFEAVEPALAAYSDAYERVLGIPAGSLPIADEQILRQWFG